MLTNSSVLIIYTGGTIGMIENPLTGALEPFNLNNIVDQVPELKRFGCVIDSLTLEPVIDSSNFHPDNWVELAGIIGENYHNYDGFVILHGTDTMAYTASALSFLFENLSKPIILTGSQLPIGMLRTDGKENLITSIEIAAAQYNNQPIVPEVCIYFENQLFRGNRTSKYSTKHFDAFYSPNLAPLATAGIQIEYNHDIILNRSEGKSLTIYDKMELGVANLKIFPGISESFIRSVVECNDVKGLILETYGSGNFPLDDKLIDCLKTAIDQDVIIVNITQCNAGKVDMGRYETSSKLLDAGVVSGFDLTFEAAITKLMFLLANNEHKNDFRSLFEKSFCGEMSVG